MSTIEKAVEKIESQVDEAAEPVRGGAPGTDTLEKIVAEKASASKRDSSSVAERQLAAQSVQSAAKPTRGGESSARGGVAQQGSPRPKGKPVLELQIAMLEERGMVTPGSPRSRIAEEFRTIKRPLLRNIDGATASPVANANLIMVSGALEGDGKTFNAINLAMSIAMEQDKTVLFVDADVSKASAGQLLGVPDGSPGLIDLLENKGLTPADVILQTNIENLRVLPAGAIHERSTELLASQSMHQLMLELSSRYPDRVIVFDSPPLLLTTEASVLASFMGQIVFVVSTDTTPSEAISEALGQIGDDKIIGVVLNKAHSRRSNLFGLGSRYGYGYGSGYGYGYGYGYGQGSKRQQDAEAKAE